MQKARDQEAKENGKGPKGAAAQVPVPASEHGSADEENMFADVEADAQPQHDPQATATGHPQAGTLFTAHPVLSRSSGSAQPGPGAQYGAYQDQPVYHGPYNGYNGQNIGHNNGYNGPNNGYSGPYHAPVQFNGRHTPFAAPHDPQGFIQQGQQFLQAHAPQYPAPPQGTPRPNFDPRSNIAPRPSIPPSGSRERKHPREEDGQDDASQRRYKQPGYPNRQTPPRN
jgi:hypothetical protein